jgi:site-specific DNA-methyltransferase (adenine-specific)
MDGKQRPVRYTKRIITNTPGEFKKAQEIIKDLPDNCAGKTVDIRTAKRRAARNRNTEQREQRHIIVPLPDEAIRLYHCCFQDLEKTAGIVPASVHLFLTDIPYDQSFLPQVADLGKCAQRILVQGGLFVCLCGQYWLHKVVEALNRSLSYRWINASVWDGDATPVHIGGWKQPHARILSKWKPLLVYSKGDFPKRGQWCDVIHVNSKEKNWHPWQQPLEEVEMLVRYFSDPGDLVVDPCGGGFTTAVACLRLGRRCISCDVEAECVAKGLERLKRERKTMTLGA